MFQKILKLFWKISSENKNWSDKNKEHTFQCSSGLQLGGVKVSRFYNKIRGFRITEPQL